MSRARRALVTLGIAVAVIVLGGSGPAGALPANPWSGRWEYGAGYITTLAQAGSSITGTSYRACDRNPNGTVIKGTVTSADGSTAEITYSGAPTCPGEGGKYTGVMSADGRTVRITGVTQYGSGFTDTMRYVGGGTEPRSAPAQGSAGEKTVSAPAPGGSRTVSSPKPLPERTTVGVDISMICPPPGRALQRTPAASCRPGDVPGTTIVGEGGLKPSQKIGEAVAACWLIGPEALNLSSDYKKKLEANTIFQRFFRNLKAAQQLLFCMNFVKWLGEHGMLVPGARRSQSLASGCTAQRVLLVATIRNGRFASVRPVRGNTAAPAATYRCAMAGETLKLTIAGRTTLGLLETLGRRLDLGVVRLRGADPRPARLTFTFRW